MYKSYKRKIYKTTDGYLNNKPKIRKPRNVVVVDQRDDKALAIVKIYSKKTHNNSNHVKKVIIKPIKSRKSIIKDSVIENKVYISRKVVTDNITKYELFYPSNFIETKESLSLFEFFKLKYFLQNNNKQQRKKYKNKIKKWKNHFK